MRRAWILVALVGCSTATAPTSFGVNLDVSAMGLALPIVQAIASLRVDVAGEAQPYEKLVDVRKVIGSGELRVHYVPGVHMGTLRFSVEALGSAGDVIASGQSGDVLLVEGRAVEARITLTAGAAVDLAVPADLSQPVDQSAAADLGVDFAASPDSSVSPDLVSASDQAFPLDQTVLLNCGAIIQCTNWMVAGGSCPNNLTFAQCQSQCQPQARPSSFTLWNNLLQCITDHCGPFDQPDGDAFNDCELHVQCAGTGGGDLVGCMGLPKGACNDALNACTNDP